MLLFRCKGNDPRTDHATGSVFVPMGFSLSWSHRLLLICVRELHSDETLSHTPPRGGCEELGVAYVALLIFVFQLYIELNRRRTPPC